MCGDYVTGGHVIIQCVSPETHASHLLILDYVTDAVVMVMPTQGKPYVSPDSRHVVTVDSETGKVFVNRVSEQGKLLFLLIIAVFSVCSCE